MRKFTLITLICVLAASALYTGFWFFSAYRFENEIAAFFAKDSQKALLKHEGITFRGFPFRIEAVIKNPLLRAKKAATFFEEASTDGKWTLGGTILGTRGWLEIAGKTTIRPFEPQSESYTLAGTLRFEVPQIKKYLNISKQIDKLIPEGPALHAWELSRNLSLSAEGLSFACDSDGQPIFEIDQLSFNWDKPQEIAPYSMNRLLKLDIKGYEIHQEQLAKLASNILKDRKDINFWMQDGIFGKNDLSLHVHILGSEKNPDTVSYCIEVEKMICGNAMGTSSITGKLEIDTLPQGVKAAISCNAVYEASKQAHGCLVSYYQTAAKQFVETGSLAMYPKWEDLLINHWDQVATLIPDNSSRGLTEAQIDVSFQVRENGTKDEDWSYDLRKCVIKTPPYAISMKGCTGFRDSDQASVFDINIPNHQQFIQDLASYYNRLQSVLTSTQTVSEMEMPPVNSKVVDRLTSFVESLSQTPGSSNDLHIVIQGNNFNNLIVGPLNSELLSLALKDLIVDVTTAMYTTER